jgi:hypothetical protein
MKRKPSDGANGGLDGYLGRNIRQRFLQADIAESLSGIGKPRALSLANPFWNMDDTKGRVNSCQAFLLVTQGQVYQREYPNVIVLSIGIGNIRASESNLNVPSMALTSAVQNDDPANHSM